MRLIDADALLEQIVHTNNVYVQGRMAYIIDNIPTAYDVEEVVSKLQELAEEHEKYWNNFDDEYSFGAMRAYENAIKIVKGLDI